MDVLLEYTGGLVLVSSVTVVLFIVTLILISVILLKHRNNVFVSKNTRLFYFSFLFVIAMIVMYISGTIGYYWGLFEMLSK